MKRVIFFVLLTNISLLTFSQNLVINAGFELWEKSNKPAGWTTAQNCLKDSANIKSGSYSCRHEGGTKYLGQTLPIVPDKQYMLTFFYKTAITGSGNGCRIWCYWKNSEGINMTDPATDNILRPSKYLKSDTWQQFSADITSPANSASFYLEIRTYQNSVAYFDDFVFGENVATYNAQEKPPELIIYPNPATDYLIISNVSDLQAYLYSEHYRNNYVVSRLHGKSRLLQFLFQGYLDGMYIISIKTIKGVFVKKFIKETF